MRTVEVLGGGRLARSGSTGFLLRPDRDVLALGIPFGLKLSAGDFALRSLRRGGAACGATLRRSSIPTGPSPIGLALASGSKGSATWQRSNIALLALLTTRALSKRLAPTRLVSRSPIERRSLNSSRTSVARASSATCASLVLASDFDFLSVIVVAFTVRCRRAGVPQGSPSARLRGNSPIHLPSTRLARASIGSSDALVSCARLGPSFRAAFQ